LLNEDLLNVAADEGPVVDDIVLETELEDADGTMDEVDKGLVIDDKAWAPPQLSGSYTKDDVTGRRNGK
jgi:hypothetical protein